MLSVAGKMKVGNDPKRLKKDLHLQVHNRDRKYSYSI